MDHPGRKKAVIAGNEEALGRAQKEGFVAIQSSREPWDEVGQVSRTKADQARGGRTGGYLHRATDDVSRSALPLIATGASLASRKSIEPSGLSTVFMPHLSQ